MLNKTQYSIDDFKIAAFADIIEESAICYPGDDSKLYLNPSAILSKLIQEAGRWCRRFSSDLFISWQSIQAMLDSGNIVPGSYLFGFREDGVDHNSFVFSRCLSYAHPSFVYRAIWRLDIGFEDPEEGCTYGKVYMRLYECSR